MERLVAGVGLLAIIGMAYALSSHKRRVDWRLVFWGTALQFILAVVVLKTEPGRMVFSFANDAFKTVLGCSRDGASFVFGNLVDMNVPVGTSPAGGPNGGLTTTVGTWARTGALFAFGVLPTVVFFSSLMAVGYHIGLMHRVVHALAWVMKRTLRTSGAESLSAAANIFVGQTEAPLLIRPYLDRMTRSELLAVMVGGMATIAGGVLAAYVGMLSERFPDIAGHLIAASVMSAPASLVISKLILPETEEPETSGSLEIPSERIDSNVIDAATRGASEGLSLALNIAAMLIAFISLIALGNVLWGMVCTGATRLTGLDLTAIDTLQEVLGYLCAPLAWLMGVPMQDMVVAGQFIGEKTVLNEFIGYAHMGDYLNGVPLPGGGPPQDLTERTKIILSYAMCGFANFGSIGILVGGLSSLAPERRRDFAQLGVRALIGGTLASFMTAAIAGMLL